MLSAAERTCRVFNDEKICFEETHVYECPLSGIREDTHKKSFIFSCRTTTVRVPPPHSKAYSGSKPLFTDWKWSKMERKC